MRLPRSLSCLVLAFGLAFPATAHASAQAPLGGGSVLQSSAATRCTAGFAAVSGKTGYLIASSACGKPGDTIRSAGRVVGVVVGTQVPPTGAIVIRVTNTTDWRLVGSIPPTGGRTITGSVEAPVGASVCRYGATTGWHCGIIQAKNVSITFPEGTLTGLTRTSVCAEPGDHGGPFVSGTQAQGVLVGGSGNCSSGGTTYFYPVNRVLSAYGLTLVTGT
ncbi:S1 family peptidase [Amycolatopsis roodepoortensis]|uniref:Streptogrisin C n=1 Tax=Amycolatopsis roodepoortensis TaxID=700274 RepID=A0ABR9LAC5_9PSEU|nr:S1 family peptidase [Amycolatopsis roodepoortensis]MBE1577639.1 streptogrisin C [Amycolatopsis roodepoortensis]